MRFLPRFAASLAVLAMAAPLAARLAAQQPVPVVGTDSVVVPADSSAGAGGFIRMLFGRHYRDLWTASIRVPVLDLARFDGGLRAIEAGGGKQTRSLRFESKGGREWVFRSVAKDARAILPERLQKSFLVGVINDQTSHAHPGGALMIPPLAHALGVLHVTPQFGVMPDDAVLGEFRESFAGMLGQIEEFPKDGPRGTAGFMGSTKVVSSVDLLHELMDKPGVRVDQPALLTARLLDFVINDWDRHKGNWRWARRPRHGKEWWLPIPRDRDQAFLWFDGFLAGVGRRVAPQLLLLEPRISLPGLTINGRELDRTVLMELTRAEWDSIARSVVERLPDSVIEAAELKLPEPYRTLRPHQMATIVKARRDGLVDAALAYYDRLAQVVDIHATDKRDVAVVETAADGGVEVRLYDGRDKDLEDDPYFHRRFVPAETRELRIYLHGGDDSLAVHGDGGTDITVRVIGGKGDDAAGPLPNAIRRYEFGPGPRDLTYGADTLFERRPQIVHGRDTLIPPRDKGTGMSPNARLRYRSDLGLVSAVGMDLERFAFRRYPYARRTSFKYEYASGPDDSRFDLGVDLRREGGGPHPVFRAYASGLELMRYYGQGNATVRAGNGDFYRAEHSQYGAELMVAQSLGWRGDIEVGPSVLYARTALDPARFVGQDRPYGSGDFGQLGARARLRFSSEGGSEAAPVRLRLEGGGSVFPALWDVAGAFGDVHATATAHLGASLPLYPVLALRMGARKVMGDYPFFESAFLGGVRNLRGYDEQRFAGDAMAFGNAELRLSVLPLTFILPGRLGVLGLADAGRVWAEGESSDTWHRAFGGGVWFGIDRKDGLVSVTVADGAERTGVYVEAGFTF